MEIQDKIAEFIKNLEWSPLSKWPHNAIADSDLLSHFSVTPAKKVKNVGDLVINNTYLFLIVDNSSFSETSKHRYMIMMFDGFILEADDSKANNNKLLRAEPVPLREKNVDTTTAFYSNFSQALSAASKEKKVVLGIGRKVGLKNDKIVSLGQYTFNPVDILQDRAEVWLAYKKPTQK